MDALGIRGGAWPLPVDWRSGDRDRFRRDLEQLPRLAEAAAILGLSRTGTWVMPEIVPTPDSERELEGGAIKARRRAISHHLEALTRIAKVLMEFDLRLGLEVIGVASFRSGRGIAFLQRLDDPDFRALLRGLHRARAATSSRGSRRRGNPARCLPS